MSKRSEVAELLRDVATQIEDGVRLDAIREGVLNELGGASGTTPWVEELDDVDWARFVEDVDIHTLNTWPEFADAVSVELGYVFDELDPTASLRHAFAAVIGWFDKAAETGEDHADVDWAKWLTALREYLKREGAEPDASVTFAEFCEALAATIQQVLARDPGMHAWTSPAQKTPRIPVNMARVLWFVSLLLWRIPEWFGEGRGAGEEIPRERDPYTGGDNPWSMP